MDKVMKRIEAEITLGTFDYGAYFPNSPIVKQVTGTQEDKGEGRGVSETPLFKEFAWEWFEEMEIGWKRSYIATQKINLECYLVAVFGEKEVGHITKSEILKFRASLAKVVHGTKTGISNDRINHVMTPLRMILAEAANRYHFTTPFVDIKPLRVPKTDVCPFSLKEVTTILVNVRPDYRNYYTVRFLTGLRTGEIDGLKWQYIDFERREIYVRETVVLGQEDTAKTFESARTVQMSQPVFDALVAQRAVTGKLDKYVFCNGNGSHFDYHNINNRVWYPLLKRLGLKRRRAYQTRHTAATLWLVAGENPEWIAKQMGHTSTQM